MTCKRTFKPATSIHCIALFTTLFLALSSSALAHGVPFFPSPRGGLTGMYGFTREEDPNAPKDPYVHYASGVRSDETGAGFASQVSEANGQPWMPFFPRSASYRWRYGVCGGEKRASKYLRGGEYYYGAKIVATFRQQQTLAMQMTIIKNHGGYVIAHVCDVSKCGGEISETCFKTPGACSVLYRRPVSECESGESTRCGPIDKKYPARFYIPCSEPSPTLGFESISANLMRFNLPKELMCQHCVLHVNYISGHRCKPDGFDQYFTGMYRPKAWGQCEFKGGPAGGYNASMPSCGRDADGMNHYTEDYTSCSDIRIVPKMWRPSPNVTHS